MKRKRVFRFKNKITGCEDDLYSYKVLDSSILLQFAIKAAEICECKIITYEFFQNDYEGSKIVIKGTEKNYEEGKKILLKRFGNYFISIK